VNEDLQLQEVTGASESNIHAQSLLTSTDNIAQLDFDPCSPESNYFLGGDVAQYREVPGINLLDRLNAHSIWSTARLKNGVEPYSKHTTGAIKNRSIAFDRAGRRFEGPNFASQDYLSLAGHPTTRAAAINAVNECGVHSAGSAALMGLTAQTIALEERMASWLGYGEATVFPTGWGAGYGIIKTLVRPTDHIVIDMLAHACLMEGARAATNNVHSFPHLSADGLAKKLARIRAENPEAGILVVTESMFSMDADTPDLRLAAQVAHQYHATIMVDCAHDLGCLGADGRGHLAQQAALKDVDVVMGSFSKTFASNGGFVASNHPALKVALRYMCGPLTFTNALSPVQAAVVLAALDVVQSAEGAARRERLMLNIQSLRSQLTEMGFEVLGQPSPIVPVVLGNAALSRLICRFTLEGGALVNLVEFPAVSRNTCRFRLQVMADHTKADIEEFCDILYAARARANAALGSSAVYG
jgi:glycine C-acetyltransferase